MWLWKGCILQCDDVDTGNYQEAVLIADVYLIIPRCVEGDLMARFG